MANLKAEVEKLMRIRRAVVEAIANEDDSNGDWVGSSISVEQEQVVATYVLALLTDNIADATYQLGPT